MFGEISDEGTDQIVRRRTRRRREPVDAVIDVSPAGKSVGDCGHQYEPTAGELANPFGLNVIQNDGGFAQRIGDLVGPQARSVSPIRVNR